MKIMTIIKKILMWPVFVLLLRPLILKDYKGRSYDLKPDVPYWADTLALKYGYSAVAPAGDIYCLEVRRYMCFLRKLHESDQSIAKSEESLRLLLDKYNLTKGILSR